MNNRPILNKVTLAAAMLLAGQAHAAGNMSIDINENQCGGGDWWMPCSGVALYDIQVNNDSNQFTVSDNTTITGTTTLNSTLGVSGATNLGSSLSVSGATTLNNGLNATGATNINTSGAAGTSIGNNTGAVNIIGSNNNILGTTNINASANNNTNINTGTSTGTVNIGNAAAGAISLHSSGSITLQSGTTSSLVTGNSGTAVTGTLSATGDLSVNSNKFTVQASSGNTAVAGTLSSVGDTTLGTASGSANVIGHGGTSTNTIQGNTNTINAGQNNNINADGSNVIRGGVASHLQAYGEGDTQGYSTYFSGQTVGGTDSGKNYEMRAGNAASQAVVTNALGNSGTVNNIIQGNTLVDGNMYINGTLVYSSNEAATTTVTSGTSALEGATQSTTGQMAIHNAGGATMDANGKLAATGATGASASLTLTNGLGNTHGVVVTEERTTLSGGTQSSSMSLADNGATFSDAATGAPIQVHGVADGSSDFDAVNVRQLYGAVAASMATAPQITGLQAGESGIGIGTGYYGGYGALGIAVTHITKKGAQLNLGVATGLQSGTKTAVRAGVGWKF